MAIGLKISIKHFNILCFERVDVQHDITHLGGHNINARGVVVEKRIALKLKDV